jgi:hypothetical protein
MIAGGSAGGGIWSSLFGAKRECLVILFITIAVIDHYGWLSLI